MTRSLLFLITLSLAACSGVYGVEYSKVGTQPLPPDKTVALNVIRNKRRRFSIWSKPQHHLSPITIPTTGIRACSPC